MYLSALISSDFASVPNFLSLDNQISLFYQNSKEKL
jgi:hypothetical protein